MGVLPSVVAGRLAAAVRLDVELLAQQGDEDLALLVAPARERLEPAEDLGSGGLVPGPDRGGIAVVVLDDGTGQRLHPTGHRAAVPMDRRRRRAQLLEL